ncbi:MAG: hypothetical protein LC768_17160 [Acidobacteria bacterium]|nr:hypothetical protein [Acidobacteriota bacterium]MCA1640023.1 hypothetical protein [Acidobacteriota bacterium]
MSRFLTKILNDKPGDIKPKLEVVRKSDQTQSLPEPVPEVDQTQTVPEPTTPQTRPRPKPSKNIAPEKDFNKRANILEREALPKGLFPGASKAIYDALYLRTIGAINPQRTIQATRKELMKWSGIKNIKTINLHLKRLKDLNLIGITNFSGEQTGSHYEVFLPKEGIPDQTQASQTGAKPRVDQKTDSDQYQKMVWDGLGKDIENKALTNPLNTSLKTNTNDDEAFAGFIEIFQSVVKEITGKKLSNRDNESLSKLADLLTLELKMAARKTDNISSVPAFLTEVLRRKLQEVPTQVNKPVKAKVDTVGKPEPDSYEIKPLDEKGREAALDQLRDFAEDEFLQDFKKWYTPGDWDWLIQELKTEEEKREKKQSEKKTD